MTTSIVYVYYAEINPAIQRLEIVQDIINFDQLENIIHFNLDGYNYWNQHKSTKLLTDISNVMIRITRPDLYRLQLFSTMEILQWDSDIHIGTEQGLVACVGTASLYSKYQAGSIIEAQTIELEENMATISFKLNLINKVNNMNKQTKVVIILKINDQSNIPLS